MTAQLAPPLSDCCRNAPIAALQQGHFLLEDPQQLAIELALKDEAMATKPHVVFAAEERSLPAQQVGRLAAGPVDGVICLLRMLFV